MTQWEKLKARFAADPVFYAEWLAKRREVMRLRYRTVPKYREYLKAYKAAHPEQRKMWRDNYKKRYPQKNYAQHRAERAHQRGRIKAPNHCEICGADSVPLQKHHPDYSKPLEVKFLCKPCHSKTHWIPTAKN